MADFPIFHGITLAQNSWIENLHVEVLAADPVPLGPGRLWFNSTNKQFKYSSLDSGGAVIVRTFPDLESMTAALNAVISDLNAEVARATAAEAALQGEIDAEETARASADSTLQSNIDAEATARAAADTALQGEIDAEETARAAADATLQSNIDAEATTRAAADAALDAKIGALGSAFNYVGTLAGGADGANALDLEAQAEKDPGDYYKVATAGYFKVGSGGTPFYANLNDGLVFNLVGGVDKIDNTNSEVSGTVDYIAVSGSADTGFVVDVAATFKGRVSTLESGLAQEITDRAAADTTLQANITAEATARAAADSAEAAARDAADVAEAAARAAADASEAADRAAADTAIRSDYNAKRFTFQSGGAATTHTVTHNLNASFVDFTVLVQRADGKYRNDVVSVEEVDSNTLKVYLSVAAQVKVAVTSMANL